MRAHPLWLLAALVGCGHPSEHTLTGMARVAEVTAVEGGELAVTAGRATAEAGRSAVAAMPPVDPAAVAAQGRAEVERRAAAVASGAHTVTARASDTVDAAAAGVVASADRLVASADQARATTRARIRSAAASFPQVDPSTVAERASDGVVARIAPVVTALSQVTPPSLPSVPRAASSAPSEAPLLDPRPLGRQALAAVSGLGADAVAGLGRAELPELPAPTALLDLPSLPATPELPGMSDLLPGPRRLAGVPIREATPGRIVALRAPEPIPLPSKDDELPPWKRKDDVVLVSMPVEPETPGIRGPSRKRTVTERVQDAAQAGREVQLSDEEARQVLDGETAPEEIARLRKLLR